MSSLDGGEEMGNAEGRDEPREDSTGVGISVSYSSGSGSTPYYIVVAPGVRGTNNLLSFLLLCNACALPLSISSTSLCAHGHLASVVDTAKRLQNCPMHSQPHNGSERAVSL